jgi:hypothetical protein
MKIDGEEVKAGKPCKYSSQEGCAIYETRPKDPCRNFNCYWLANNELPGWMNPESAKVILKPNFMWERPSSNIPVYLANAVGPKIPGKTRNWLLGFTAEKGINILCSEPLREAKQYTGQQHHFGIGTVEFTAEVDKWREAGYPFLFTTR